MLCLSSINNPSMFNPNRSDGRHISSESQDPQSRQSHAIYGMEDYQQQYTNLPGYQNYPSYPPSMPVQPQMHHPGPYPRDAGRVRLHHPYQQPAGRRDRPEEPRNAAPVRRRVSRACDQCNQLRTKCDATHPCSHCIESDLECTTFREQKKRGKASRKDLEEQRAAQEAAAAAGGTGGTSGSTTPVEGPSSQRNTPRLRLSVQQATDSMSPNMGLSPTSYSLQSRSASVSGSDCSPISRQPDSAISRQSGMGTILEHGSLAAIPARSAANSPTSAPGYPAEIPMMQGDQHGMQPNLGGGNMYSDVNYSMVGQHDASFPRPAGSSTSSAGFMNPSPIDNSPLWANASSPRSATYPGRVALPNMAPKYPILQSLIPHLKGVIPLSLASDLLEQYFETDSSQAQPLSPFLLAHVFRKRSFLHKTQPRATKPALLASMLWVAAQSSTTQLASATARATICQNLLNLTVRLLQPLVHGQPSGGLPQKLTSDGIHGVASLIPPSGQLKDRATLDDIATYLHIATVISASEQKAASLRWWNVAWSIAREMRLGQELPHSKPADLANNAGPKQTMPQSDGRLHQMDAGFNSVYSETREGREERRRMWWLLYTVDRHLALCFNRPLFLLDEECQELYQPIDDELYQADDFYTADLEVMTEPSSGAQVSRRKGPIFECTSSSPFGFFTPLMTVLGEIVDLRQARARFGQWALAGSPIDDPSRVVARLGAYAASLDRLDNKLAVAYGRYLAQALHVLLAGRWDPQTMLFEDPDPWPASTTTVPPFDVAVQHAINAAETLPAILTLDPALRFIQFFFPTYLLQASSVLLVSGEQATLTGEPVTQDVLSACELVAQAASACVETDQQRNFRDVINYALSQMKGAAPFEHNDGASQNQHRNEILSMYRWIPGYMGLAL